MVWINYYKALIIICIFVVFNATAALTTQGYVQKMPNDFWPFTTSTLEVGTPAQQLSPLSNPDVFCQQVEPGYRLPSWGEFYASGIATIKPWYPQATASPSHWSNYVDYDITKPLKTSYDGRVVGSLWGEWGKLSSYANKPQLQNGWVNDFFWVTEPVRSGGSLRQAFQADTTATHPSGNPALFIRTACVYDLIPTPIDNLKGSPES